MPAVKHLDAGDNVLLTGSSEQDLAMALQSYVERGSRVLSPPARMGSNWVAVCSMPPIAPLVDETSTLRLTDLGRSKPREVAAEFGAAARRADAGHMLVFSGPTRASVAAALEVYVKQGSRVISEVSLLGNTWMATCEKPEVPLSGCRVEEIGLKRLVTGPSHAAVAAKVAELAQLGAVLVGEIEEANGEWTALCDTGSAGNTGFRW